MSNADGAGENIDLRKLEMIGQADQSDDRCCTFVLQGEDHTLGNALRCMLSKNPEVSFCGYCIPHPSETKINLRIQSFNRPAVDCLQQGLTNLHSLGKHVLDTFEKAVATYKNNSASRESSMEIDGAGR